MLVTKKQIFQKIDQAKSSIRKGSFSFKVCKLIKDGEFDKVLSSQELTNLLNEGPGKKFKTSNLTAAITPLLQRDIVKVKNVGKRRSKKYWFPAWIDKRNIESELSPSVGSVENRIFFLSGNNAWTDSNKKLPSLINSLEGDICIVDPFYGNGTFFTLEKFGKGRKVRFLSARLGREEQDNVTKFEANLKKFKKEFKNIKIKKYDKFYELHDRYIIADNALVVVGHGIKDFGNKESFVIFLPKKEVSNFLPTLRTNFEKRWKKSNDIT